MRLAAKAAWRREATRYVFTGVGGLICGIAINAFFVPHFMLSGGISGIAMILHYLVDWPIGMMIAVFNIPLFYAAYRFMDRSYFLCALYGLIMFTASIDATSFLTASPAVDDTLLSAVYGGLVSGIGSGIVFRFNGSLGGTDIVVVLAKKYFAINAGPVLLGINGVLMTVAAFLFGAKPAMFTLIAMYLSAVTVDKVIAGFNTKKTVLIVSDCGETIAAAIMNEVGRGVTFIQGQGAFTREDKKVVFVVVTLTQMAKIKPIVDAIDCHALMIVQDAVEVLGHGFSLPKYRSEE
ncbi:YitT family protein [Anaeroselena agilis]|uniref:YitT family protein n=1 Tax=Anaeroselena agilis TaxID=3063788 RepID=A0ABU3NUU7_9FIRM|nr:YitT family protein [Selenomonadales bacterium 4137-cl]